MNDSETLLPGAVVGVIGGGQLGRYFVLEARRMGYDTWVLDPDKNSPAMQICEHQLVASYDDAKALAQLAGVCDAITVEFENVPANSLALLESTCRVAPSAACIQIAQDRVLEKKTAERHGLVPVPYASIRSEADIVAASERINFPAILKTSRLGYDGKGQYLCNNVKDALDALSLLNHVECVLEQRINLSAEVSVVLARRSDGQTAVFPLSRNTHVGGILSTSTVPSGLNETLLETAQAQALKLAQGIDYVGIMAVEFFVDDTGQVLFNEMAPRPHNSGHYTLDATGCSQFEQQLRALCHLPLGDTRLKTSVCMLNILGDIWSSGNPEWLHVFNTSGAHLHLYGKSEARPGRKMGHINFLGSHPEDLEQLALDIHGKLG